MAVVQQLLEAGSSINARTASGTNALYNAATAGHVEAVQRLIDAGSELDVQAANGLTVLHSAASNGHCEVCGLQGISGSFQHLLDCSAWHFM